MKLTAYILILLPIVWSGTRFLINEDAEIIPFSDTRFEVTYEFNLEGEKDLYRVRSFLPTSNERQVVRNTSEIENQLGFIYMEDELNKQVTWLGTLAGDTTLTFTFQTSLRAIEYEFEENILPQFNNRVEYSEFLQSTKYIQSIDPIIQSLATDLIPEGIETENEIARIFYEYVYRIPGSKISDLTDAVTMLGFMEKLGYPY